MSGDSSIGIGIGLALKSYGRAFRGLLNQYPGAAAAYSLRKLSGAVSNVVRVRRASDNSEQDFTALQVSSGDMVNWVNAQIVPPLDIRELDANGERTGDLVEAAAAYSLRNLSASYTGNVVDVRRSSDNAEESFTAEEVSDGTLRNFCLNDNADIISFADAGLAGSPAADKRMYFDGVDDDISYTQSSAIGTSDFKVEFTLDYTSSAASGRIVQVGVLAVPNNGWFVSLSSGNLFVGIDDIFQQVVTSAEAGHYEITYDRSGNVAVVKDGVGIGTPFDISSKSAVNISETSGVIGGRPPNNTLNLSGATVSNFSFDYNNDGTADQGFQGYGNTNADWVDTIGSNDGTVNGSPDLFTGQGFDGFVTQWYDQSGNANHATQGTPASQPKIVDGGSLVSGGLEFDGVDDSLGGIPNLFSGTSAVSSFIVGNADTTATSEAMFSHGSNNILGNGFTVTSEIAFRPGGNTIYNDDFIDANPLLLSTIAPASSTSADVLMFLNGSTLGQTSTTSTALDYGIEEASIGKNFFSSVFYDGRLSEIIVYPSDQTDNRTAIEANIGETYGLDLPSGVDTGYDEVDGFVVTWYDQSGNGNDAVQATIAQQRKIVDSGTLVTEGGKPAIAGNIYGMELSSTVSLAGAFSILAVYNADEGEALLGSNVNNPRIRIFTESIEIVNNAAGEINITNTDNPPTSHTFNGSRIMFGLYRDASNVVQATIAGQTVADDALTLSGNFSFTKLFTRGNDIDPMDNKFQELIIWPYDIR